MKKCMKEEKYECGTRNITLACGDFLFERESRELKNGIVSREKALRENCLKDSIALFKKS